MLENAVSIFSRLGATARVNVGISVTPNLGVEMIEVNTTTCTVSKYAFRKLVFDYTKREIVDYDLFKEAIVELFEELDISPKSNVTLNLPNIFFGLTTLPQLLPNDAINNAIISEVEQSYIFKRAEPIVSWCSLGESNEKGKKVAFSAIQQNMLVEITEIFKSLGTTLIAIETEPLSILKALDYLGLYSNYLNSDKLWNLIIVNSVSYTIFELSGKTITNYYEEPLALKSFVDDEIYNAIITSAVMNLNKDSLKSFVDDDNYEEISNSATNNLQTFKSKDCLIISETDLVSAEILALKLPEDYRVQFIECNKYTEKVLVPTELTVLPNNATKITLQAVGAGIYHKSTYPIKFNLLGIDLSSSVLVSDYPKIQFGNTEIELTPKFVRISMFLILIIIITPILLLMLLFNRLAIGAQNTYNDLKKDIEKVNLELKEYGQSTTNNFDLNKEIKDGVDKNKEKLIAYTVMGLNLPPKLWLIKVTLDDKIEIIGGSKDIESIYVFYKNLRNMTNMKDLRIQKLYMASENQPEPDTDENEDENKDENNQKNKDDNNKNDNKNTEPAVYDIAPDDASYYKFVISN